VRGFLIHISHYDPQWCKVKAREKPFDLDLGLEIVDTMWEVGLNLLVIDCADGVRYKSHPELARKYTVPMSHLGKLVNRAQEKGIEVVPKLNFSQSIYGNCCIGSVPAIFVFSQGFSLFWSYQISKSICLIYLPTASLHFYLSFS